MTGSEVVPFLVWDYSKRDGQCLRVFPLDEATIREYVSWAPRNTYVRQEPRLRTGEVRVIEPNDPAVRDSEFYNEWLKPRVGVGHNLSSCVASEAALSIHLSPLRDPRGPPYGDDEVRLMTALMPHLLRATSVQRRLGDIDLERAAAAEALDRLPTGVLLLGPGGAAQFLNAEARRILATGDGLSLDRSGRLRAARPFETARLERLVAAACATGSAVGFGSGGSMRVARISGRRPFQLIVSPLRVRSALGSPLRPCAVVLVSDPDRPSGWADDALRELFGFTPAEARVARLLAEGWRVAEIAGRLEVTEATVRTHLKRLLDKVECRTQVDLMRVLCAVPPTAVPR